VSGKVSEVEVSYEVTDGVLNLIGGPTGYESFCIKDATISRMTEKGWWACAGTKDRWDSVFIPAEEMRKAFETLKDIHRSD
jgi:hypothetical protein